MDIKDLGARAQENTRDGYPCETAPMAPSSPDHDVVRWQEELARITARLEELNAWMATESSRLQRHLAREITDLQATMRRMDADMTSVDVTSSAHRIAARLEALQAQSDAAYAQLRASLEARPSGSGQALAAETSSFPGEVDTIPGASTTMST